MEYMAGSPVILFLLQLTSVEKLWQKGLCASLYNASWTSKTWDSQCSPISVDSIFKPFILLNFIFTHAGSEELIWSWTLSHPLSQIEDFTDRSQNVARVVGMSEAKTIYECIRNSVNCLLLFLDGHVEGHKMGELLFGSGETLLSPLVKLVPNHEHGGPTSRSRRNKKRKMNEDSLGKSVSKPWRGNPSRSSETWSPWISNRNRQLVPSRTPLIASSVSGSFPALSPIDLVALCSLLSQQPGLPRNSPAFNISQFKPSNGNAASWPNSGTTWACFF